MKTSFIVRSLIAMVALAAIIPVSGADAQKASGTRKIRDFFQGAELGLVEFKEPKLSVALVVVKVEPGSAADRSLSEGMEIVGINGVIWSSIMTQHRLEQIMDMPVPAKTKRLRVWTYHHMIQRDDAHLARKHAAEGPDELLLSLPKGF